MLLANTAKFVNFASTNAAILTQYMETNFSITPQIRVKNTVQAPTAFKVSPTKVLRVKLRRQGRTHLGKEVREAIQALKVSNMPWMQIRRRFQFQLGLLGGEARAIMEAIVSSWTFGFSDEVVYSRAMCVAQEVI